MGGRAKAGAGGCSWLRGTAQDTWRPWRGVAAHLMWAYYHVVKKRDGIGLQTKTKVAAKKHWPQIKKTKAAKSVKKATRTAPPVKRAKKAKGARRAN